MRTGHNLSNMHVVSQGVAPARGWAGPEVDGAAFGVFCGYLVIDALIVNTDRHKENWAAISSQDAVVRLCASHDRATSLGFNLRNERLNQPALELGRLHARPERGTAGVPEWAAPDARQTCR